MKDKLNRILELIKGYWGAISAIVAAVTLISTIAVKVYIAKAEKSQIQVDVHDLNDSFKSFRDSSLFYFQRLDIRQNRIERSVIDMHYQLTDQAEAIKTIHQGFSRHLLRDSEKTQEYLEYLKSIDFELKKNDITGMLMIP
jgi:hypothetical protein